MKRIFLSISLVFFLGQAFSKAVIYGRISNTTATGIKVSYKTSTLVDSWKDFKSTIDKKGNYKVVLDITSLQEVILNVGDKYQQLFIEPNDSLNYSTDARDFYVKASYSGVGSKNNLFKHKYYNEFGHIYNMIDYRTVMYFAQTSNEKGLIIALDSIYNYYSNFLEKHKNEITNDFYNRSKIEIYYQFLCKKLFYAPFNINVKFKGGVRPKMSAYSEYYSFLDTLSLDNDSLLQYKIYNDFLYHYAIIKRDFLMSSSNREPSYIYSSKGMYIISDFLFTGKTREHMMTNFTILCLERETQKPRDKIYSMFKNDVSDSVYVNLVEKAYAKNKDRIELLKEGDTFPTFSLTDMKGNTISNESLKGKVVYMDFWATWCKGCMQDMPDSKALKEKLSQSNSKVEFLYFNCSDTQDKWKAAIAKHKIEGTHIYMENNKAIEMFSIKGYPTYFVLDKTGIISKIDSRPSDENTYKLLKELSEK